MRGMLVDQVQRAAELLELEDRSLLLAVSAGIDSTALAHALLEIAGRKRLKLVIDPSMRVMRGLRVVGLPMTFLIGPTAKEIGRLIGPSEWDTAEMVAFFKTQIDQTKQ